MELFFVKESGEKTYIHSIYVCVEVRAYSISKIYPQETKLETIAL